MEPRIRVVIADDQLRCRDGLRALLATRPEVEVVGEAADGWEAVRLMEECRPDVVLMDARMPGMNGLEATRRIGEVGCAVVLPAVEDDSQLSLQGGQPGEGGGAPDLTALPSYAILMTVRSVIH